MFRVVLEELSQEEIAIEVTETVDNGGQIQHVDKIVPRSLLEELNGHPDRMEEIVNKIFTGI